MARLVVLSDTHMLHRRLIVPDGDVLLHCGDLSGEGTTADYDDVFDWLASFPHEHKVLVAGNHDALLQQFPALIRKRLPKGIEYLEDSGTTISGLRFWGSPWTLGYAWMAFTMRRIDNPARIWAKIPDDTDVLVTHGPPYGILDRGWNGQPLGDPDLMERVKELRLRLHLFGHVHEQNGEMERFGTRFVNAAIGDDDEEPNLSARIHVIDV